MSDLLRGGRLSAARKDITEFTSSIKSDAKLLKHVVQINKAHVIMLIENGIIHRDHGSKILEALSSLEDKLTLMPNVEDVHIFVEEEVIRRVGMDIGGNLNLAKSRNDQVATAIRMALREELLHIMEMIITLQETLIELAEKNIEVVVPGYTHLQPAQPTTFAHYILAQFDILERNLKRLANAYKSVNLCPMGAGALATTSFPISRERVADLLGFNGLIENSIDAVSSRDFLLETLAALSIIAVDISRFVEDLLIWSSLEFSIIDLPDEFTSTSSIMPQKKNPEILEVIRARMGLVLSDFTAASIILKGLPSTYNLDFQETTPKLWDAIEVIFKSLWMLSEVVRNLKVKEDAMKKPFLSFLTATEVANMLTRNYGVPFRIAHRIVGALVKALIDNGKTLLDATPEYLTKVSAEHFNLPLIVKTEDLSRALDLAGFIESHSVRGGPSKKEVERMISTRKKLLSDYRDEVLSMRRQIESAMGTLNSITESYVIQRSLSSMMRQP